MSISNIKDVIRYNHLQWFSHLQHMDEEKWHRKMLNFEVNGRYSRDWLKKRWFDNIRCDFNKLSLSTSLALDHVKWKIAIKPSRHVAESNPCCLGKERH